MTNKCASSFSRCVLRWYRKNGRSLPWRDDLKQEKNPSARAYRAWIAETMLQQTTVATVLSRYRPFLKIFPTIDTLAAASLESLLHAWQGLGYYARARRLHTAAQNIAVQGFPSDLSGWRALAGVGDYTASALNVFLTEQSLVVTDTNIRRLYSRIFAENFDAKITEPAKSLLKDLLPPQACGDYTQALMDLGATICKTRLPRCEVCPIQSFCKAYRCNAVGDFPAVRAKVQRPLRQATALLVVRREGARRFLLFRQSETEALLGGLSELPASDFRKKNHHENGNSQQDWQKLLARLPIKTDKGRLLQNANVSHGFTHFRLALRLVEAQVAEDAAPHKVAAPYFWQEADEKGQFPTLALSTLMRKVLAQYQGALTDEMKQQTSKRQQSRV